MTQRLAALLLSATLLPVLFAAQQEVQDYQIYTEPPRLLLNARRLRLLQRERERQSIRWVQFESMMTAKAKMAEPGFAGALFAVVTDNAEGCRQTGEWIAAQVKPDSPSLIRQAALVVDWCGTKLPDTLASSLRKTLTAYAARPATSTPAVRSRVMAAFAVADDEPKLAETVAKETAEIWWKQGLKPKLLNDLQPIPTREDLYATVEILHLFRDNLKIEFKDEAVRYFEELPSVQLLTYYPQPWPAAENEYRIPMYTGNGDPNLEEAAFSRAAELALVAYDGNPQPIQFLQGWLLQDRFLMRGTFGLPYEFLWANPYLPGLSYTYMPDLFYGRGALLVRATWDEDSSWFAAFRGNMQYFSDGKRMTVTPKGIIAPLNVGDVTVHFWRDDLRFEAGTVPLATEEGERKTTEELAFVAGAKPGAAYDVEVDGQEMFEARADEGGLFQLKFLRGYPVGVRIRLAPVQTVRIREN